MFISSFLISHATNFISCSSYKPQITSHYTIILYYLGSKIKIAQLVIYGLKWPVANDLIISCGPKQFLWKLRVKMSHSTHTKDLVICKVKEQNSSSSLTINSLCLRFFKDIIKVKV